MGVRVLSQEIAGLYKANSIALTCFNATSKKTGPATIAGPSSKMEWVDVIREEEE